METLQNVSNCYKSEKSPNKNDLPYYIVVLVIIWGLPGLVWSLLGEKLRFLVFMFAESLELIKGRKQFHTAPHWRFDKFHHNKRIALKLQRCILGSCAYLCSFSYVFIWSAHRNHCEKRFDDKMAPSRGEAEWDCPQAKGDTVESREVGLTGKL